MNSNSVGVNEEADHVPPSSKALREALLLSDEILKNIEMSELPLANASLKVSRLARLLNDFDFQKIFEYEASGYPSSPTGLPPSIYHLAVKAGREWEDQDVKTKEVKKYVYIISIEGLEFEAKSLEAALVAAKDPSVSISSANPSQTIFTPIGNIFERERIRANVSLAQHRLASRRSFLYSYVLQKNYELKFSEIADDIFSRIRTRVDSEIGQKVPGAVQKLSAVYDNLKSDNSEDWANAVHSCRRILQEMANSIYPPRDDVVIESNGKKKNIKLGVDNYINRIIAFIQERSVSERFVSIVGSHLYFIGDRLDSVFQAAQKGSHANIVTKEEADRYVVYTYLVVGDLLSLT